MAWLPAAVSGVVSRRLCAIIGRNGLCCWLRQQGCSARSQSHPNPRLQAPRPGARLLGGRNAAHHPAVPAAIAVAGARLKRSVMQTYEESDARR